MPEPIILPTTFNELLIVDAPATNKSVKLVWLNIDIDVAFKLFIDSTELLDNEFKLLKMVVDVAFILFIDIVWPFINPNFLKMMLLLLHLNYLLKNNYNLINCLGWYYKEWPDSEMYTELLEA